MENTRRSCARWRAASLLGLASLFCAAAVRGAPPDFAAEFRQLEALGATNVSNATYVRLAVGWPFSDELRVDGLLPYDFESVGNAWLLRERPATGGLPASATFLVNGGELVDVERADEDAEFLETPTTDRAVPRGTWTPATYPTDAKRALRFLKTMSREGHPEIRLDARVQARLFLFALQLNQKGEPDAAGQIASTLLTLIPERRPALAARNLLADSQYLNLYQAFRTEHNWTNYRDGIRVLLDRYPADWQAAPAVALLLARVEQRLAAPAPLPAETDGLTELDRQQAAALLHVREVQTPPRYYASRNRTSWLLPSTWATATLTNANADLQIRARGVQALPLLLALIGDKALTDAETPRPEPGAARFSFLSGAEVGTEARFDALRRPATRGELASQILSEMLPGSVIGESWNRLTGDRLVMAAKSFYDAHKTADEEELAVQYLNDDSDTASPAVRYLLRAATERRVPALENYLLGRSADGIAEASVFDLKQARARADLAVRYAAARGAEARPFIGQVAAKIEQDARKYLTPEYLSFDPPKENRDREEQRRTDMLKAAADLAALPYGAPLDDLLATELAGNKVPGRELLLARLEELPRPELVHVLLRKAVDVATPLGRATLARLLAEVEQRRLRGEDRPATLGRDADGSIPDAALWRTLVTMDDQARDHTDVRTQDPFFCLETSEPLDPAGVRVADLFLCLHEQVFTPPTTEPSDPSAAGYWRERQDVLGGLRLDPDSDGLRASTLILEYGLRGRDFVLGRVLARLDDQQPSPYPGQAPLPTPTLDALRRKFDAVKARDKAAALAAALPLPEFAALPDLLRTNAVLNARLTALADTITQVSAPGDAALQRRLEPWVGRTLSPELIRLLQEACAVAATNGNAVSCLVAREEGFGGCSVRVETLPAADASGKVVGYTGLICARGLYEPCRWRTTPLPAQVGWGTFGTSDPDRRTAFQRAVEALCGANSDASSASIVKFTVAREADE